MLDNAANDFTVSDSFFHFRSKKEDQYKLMWDVLIDISGITDECYKKAFYNSPVKNLIRFKLYKALFHANRKNMQEVFGCIKDDKLKNKVLNYSFDYNYDCDCSNEAKSILQTLIKSQGAQEITIANDDLSRFIDFEFNGKNYCFETDTIHSLDAMLNAFLRKADEKNNWISKYYEQTDNLNVNSPTVNKSELLWPYPLTYNGSNDKGYRNRDLWIALIIDEVYAYYEENNQKMVRILNAFERWAEIVDTIGNIMIGPQGFNAGKKSIPGSKEMSHANSKLNKGCFGSSTEAIDVFLHRCNTEPTYADKYWKQWIIDTINLQKMEIYKCFIDDVDAFIGGQPENTDNYSLQRICTIFDLIIARTQIIESVPSVHEVIQQFKEGKCPQN